MKPRVPHRQSSVLLRLMLLALALQTMSLHAAQPRVSPGQSVTIATWNLEWLVAPETARDSRLACRASRRATLPCDVAEDQARDSADVARLASYAQRLNADVIAFQEVESAAIAKQVFAGYRICMTDGRGVQEVGFAIREGLSHRCGPEFAALSLHGRVRAGMQLTLLPGTAQQVELLAIHLKSGCARDRLDSAADDCRTLREQAEQLATWIRPRVARRARFVVLGDFNRNEPGRGDERFWRILGTGVSHAEATLPFRNCSAGQTFSQYIDHILLSDALLSQVIPGSVGKLTFDTRDASRYRLSDHCPVKVALRLGQSDR